jgi:hypothetical protein
MKRLFNPFLHLMAVFVIVVAWLAHCLHAGVTGYMPVPSRSWTSPSRSTRTAQWRA